MAVAGDVDVVGGHVPVDDALLVDGLQGLHDGGEEAHHLPPVDPAPLVLDVGLEADALHILHDEVGGAVLLEVAAHPHDVWVAQKLGQHPGLIQEALQAVAEVLLPLPGEDGDLGGAGDPGGHGLGQELLDGHLDVQHLVQGQVGDAEAALAQHPAQDVLSGQDAAVGEGEGVFVPVHGRIVAAAGAGAVPLLPLAEAVVAVGHSHVVLSPLIPPRPTGSPGTRWPGWPGRTRRRPAGRRAGPGAPGCRCPDRSRRRSPGRRARTSGSGG